MVHKFYGPFQPQCINLSPDYLRKGPPILTVKSNEIVNFQNDQTNQKFYSKLKLNLVLKQHHMWNPRFFLIFNRFHRTQNNLALSNDHTIKEFSWVISMATGHAQYCHLTISCPVTVSTVKTIVIAGHLPYQITQINFQGFVIWMSGGNGTGCLLWFASDEVFVVPEYKKP